MKVLFALAAILQIEICRALHQGHILDRRKALATAAGAAVVVSSQPVLAADEETVPYESRNRNGNKQALVREDYWYMMGKTPPRKLDALSPDSPKWNAWGSCASDSGGNACTYVPLKQRIPAYSKYAFNIALGAKEYQQLGDILKQVEKDEAAWARASTLISQTASPPPPAVDALLKMALFASGMLSTPNFSGVQRDLLVARFYVNEADFATKETARAIEERNVNRALNAWEFGKDSWNSYLNIVNRNIVPKVGEPIPLIE